jgi:hypothetical protein
MTSSCLVLLSWKLSGNGDQVPGFDEFPGVAIYDFNPSRWKRKTINRQALYFVIYGHAGENAEIGSAGFSKTDFIPRIKNQVLMQSLDRFFSEV